jgi:hypothetical protein
MRLKFFVLFAIPLLVASCLLDPEKEKSSLTFHRVEKDALKKYINEKPLPEEPNLSVDKVIVNNDYPIEISLYNDSKFYYNLPKLGDGVGSWVYNEGRIELFAERSLFDVYIEVLSLDEKGEDVGIRFRDRFGPKTMPMTKFNTP